MLSCPHTCSLKLVERACRFPPPLCAVRPFFARTPAAAPVSSHQHLATPYGKPLLPLQPLVMLAAPITPFPPPLHPTWLFSPACPPPHQFLGTNTLLHPTANLSCPRH
ncbi:hypothetical protein C8J57DRAFT_1514769 [Mycena rebaudengoi]|nr:hypothetical protein C8J57DRAFT_1514769 [Mycena rebaudengoi]